MTRDPRQLAESDYLRAATGRPVRSSARPGRQPHQGPVKVAGELHLAWTGDEDEGRRRMLALVSTLTVAGFSEVALDGPHLVTESVKPRRAQ